MEDKIAKQFTNFYLRPYRHTDKLIHLYADFVELVALVYNGDFATPSNIARRYKVEQIELIKGGVKKGDEIGSRSAEADDDNELFIDSIFNVISERVLSFGEFYPFVVKSQGVKLKAGVEQDEKMKIYLALLLSSNLNYFPQFEPELTTEFEEISYRALLNYLPQSPKSIIKQFGKNTDYIGNAENKITDLAKDLRILINEDEIFGVVEGNKERGLDVIGWIPFHDRIPNMLVILAQCSCGKEWYKKQSETERYENYYRFYRLKPIHTMFIPYALAQNHTGFYQRDELAPNRLLFERGRILQFIEDASFVAAMNTNIIVERCIAFQEDVI